LINWPKRTDRRARWSSGEHDDWADHRPAVRRRLHRRVDNALLRWQARLESPFSDRSLPWMLAGGLFVTLFTLAVARVRGYEASESLARYTQATAQLHSSFSTELTLLPAGVRAPQRLADLDGSLLFHPIGWLLGFLPVAEALVVLQAAALAITVLPLWGLARRVARLRVSASLALVVAYGLYPPLHLMNTSGFHPQVLAVPLLMLLVYRSLAGSVVQPALAALGALALSTQLASVLVGFGVLLAFTVRRRGGIALIILGSLAMVGEQTVSWLGAGDHAFVDGVSFWPGTRSVLGVWGHALAHPIETTSHLGQQEVLVAVAALLLPAALLPLMSLRHLAPAVPLQATYLLGDVPAGELLGPLAAPSMVFVFTATTFALARLGRQGSDRVTVSPRLGGALAGVAVLFFALDAPSSIYNSPWDWGRQDRADEARGNVIAEALALQPDDDDPAAASFIIAATPDLTPRLADDVAVCTLPLERFDCPGDPSVYVVDRQLDDTTPLAAELILVGSDGDGRFSVLRPRRP
jgi:hypothetical protein